MAKGIFYKEVNVLKLPSLDYLIYRVKSIYRLGKTCPSLSRKINRLLDDETTTITIVDELEAQVGNLSLWTGNYPYAYGSLLSTSTRMIRCPLPDRKTVYRLHKVLSFYKALDDAFEPHHN
jgi:hypothetical protein